MPTMNIRMTHDEMAAWERVVRKLTAEELENTKMTTTEQYIAAEPETAMVYVDQTGKFWETREAAIQANFEDDCRMAWEEVFRSDPVLEQCPMGLTKIAAVQFIANNPDLVRVMLGDRDAT